MSECSCARSSTTSWPSGEMSKSCMSKSGERFVNCRSAPVSTSMSQRSSAGSLLAEARASAPRHEDQASSPASEAQRGQRMRHTGGSSDRVGAPSPRRASETGDSARARTLIRSGGRRRGLPPRAIQELAGHRELGMAQRFMHLSPAAFTCDSAARSTGHHARTLETGRVGRTEDQWIKWR
jgi:hypothetical protein